MNEAEKGIAQIRSAFAAAEYPGDWCLRGSNEGEEPYLLEKEFKGKTDWRVLDGKFLDQAPDGYGSALSFFSDEAFRFYLPAYMIADLRGELKQADPVYHLSMGLEEASRNSPINPRRYGERTWFDHARYKFSIFNSEEARAIVAYLNLSKSSDEFSRQKIDEALKHYWLQRAESAPDRV
jgi:hypothetical protein